MSFRHDMLTRRLGRQRRGVAMITAVVAAAAAASIVLVLVHLSLSDLRSAAAAEETAAARAEASAAIAELATELAVEPSYWVEQVHPRERARVCVSQALAPVIQPGSVWPAECGTVWTYVDPVDESSARLEIHPPSPQNRHLVVYAVGRSGATLAARAATFTQPTAGAWTVMSMADLEVDDVMHQPAGANTVRGASLYSTNDVHLPQGSIELDRSVVVAEGTVSGYAMNPGDPELGIDPYPEPDSNRLYASSVQSNIGDLRDVVPSPFTLGQLRSSAEVARLNACRGVEARNISTGEGARSTHMCLRRSVRLHDVTGASVRVPADTAAYLLITRVVNGEGRIALYTAAALPSPATEGDLRSAATLEVAAGTHPGDATAPMWRHLGEFFLPANGLVVTDRDVYLGACGSGFLSNGPCDTQAGSSQPGMAVASPFTVISGSEARPADVYIGSPVHDQGGLLGAAAFGKVHVPYWARPALGTLNIDMAVAALGADDGLPGFRQFPEEVDVVGANVGGALVLTGSLADSEADLSAMTQFTAARVEPSTSSVPPHFPATRRQWVDTADRPAPLTEVCGDAVCEGWLGGGTGSGGSDPVPPPAVPGPLTVAAGSGSAEVTWPPVDDAELYRVFWTRVAGGYEYAAEVDAFTCTATCSATLEGLTNGVRYRVQVDATGDSDNTSARSSPAEFVPDGLPGAPTDVAAIAIGPEQIRVEWNRDIEGPRPSGFRVYRDNMFVAQTTVEFWVDPAASPGATHTYHVRSINDAGESSPSDPVTVVVMPGRPVELTLVGGVGEVAASWETNPGTVDGYRVYRSGTDVWPGESGLIADLSSAETTFTDVGLSDGRRYWYWVTAHNVAGESPPAREDAPTLPSAVSAFAASPVEGVGGRISAEWTAPEGQEITGYRVYRSGDVVWEGSTTMADIDGIDPATDAAYVVHAINESGEGSPSSAPVARPVPHTPTSLNISVTGTTYSGSYDVSSGADTYTVDVQRHVSGDSPSAHGTNTQTATSFSSNASLSSTRYRVRVRATNPSGNSAWSDWTEWSQWSTPRTPTGFSFTDATSNAISYSWGSDEAAANYQTQRQGSSTTPDPLTTPAYTWTGLAASNNVVNTYNFRVRSCNGNGCSDWTGWGSMTTRGYLRYISSPSNNSANSSGAGHVVSVPAGVKRVYLRAIGGAGAPGQLCQGTGIGSAGFGANMRGTLNVAPGQSLVGNAGKRGMRNFGGWPGGGSGPGAVTLGSCSFLGAGAGGGFSNWSYPGGNNLIAGGGGGGGSANNAGAVGGNGANAGPQISGSTITSWHAPNGADALSAYGVGPLGGTGGRSNGARANGRSCAGPLGGGYTCAGGANSNNNSGGNATSYGGAGGGGYGGGAGGSGISGALAQGWGAGGGGGSSVALGSIGGPWVSTSTQANGEVCVGWHGDTTCGGSTPFVP